MGFFDCCSAFITALPDPAVPLLPSLVLGTSFASVILLYLYKKETNLPLRDILFHAARNLFCALPESECTAGHSDSEQCDSVECVRCARHEVLRRQIKERWRTWRSRKVELGPLKRVEEAVRKLEGTGRVENLQEEGRTEDSVKFRGKGKVNPPSENEKEKEAQESSKKKEEVKLNEEIEDNVRHREKGREKDSKSSLPNDSEDEEGVQESLEKEKEVNAEREMEDNVRYRGKGKQKGSEENTQEEGDQESPTKTEEAKPKEEVEGDTKYRGKGTDKESEDNIRYRGKGKEKGDRATPLEEESHESSKKKEEGKPKEGVEGDTKYRGKARDKTSKDAGKSSQHPTLFSMDLTANPDWSGFEVHVNDQKLLKLNLELIQKEFTVVFEALKSGDNSGWRNNNIPQGHWCIYPFVNQGKIIAPNCRRCPGVAELVLGCLPAMMNDCVFGNAAFSILYPNSHITPHHGPTNLRLRCHLGLKVPPGCWLEVAGQQHRWGVGETLLFDDSFTHSAFFGSRPSDAQCEPRAVLLLDFWHPDVSDEEKVCLLDLLAPLD